ncbi:MAG: DNA primase [Candidatus Melainabacteria bacterium]|nr:MAG: DNA primase [Candidatus Melainabacteria bacterium]
MGSACLSTISHDDIAEVRSRANILEVVSEHVTMKRSGTSYMGRCPFHEERSASFSVVPDKGFFHCFGCHAKGDVYAFLMKIKGMDFPSAVRELAHKYGVQLVETAEQREEYDKRTHMLMLYQQASQYFIRLLHDPAQGAVARDYLSKRGIPEDIIERFKIGYAGPTWDGLLNYLTSTTKVAPATLEEAGLVRRKHETNSFYDLFRNRLMIPICDDRGQVIAFGGRTLGNDDAKYVNSPESLIYVKNRQLYAFNLAKESIKARDAVIVVEGYFDAITPHQFGFTNTVATCGTALSEAQARSLVRYTESKRVYLAFDADAAGASAIERGAHMLQQVADGVGLELRVLRIPGAKDPDECLRSEGGPEAFAEAIENAPLLVDYQLDQALDECDIGSHVGKIDAARKVIPILAQIKNSVERGEYIRQLSMKVGVREEELLSDVSQYRKDNRIGVNPGNAPSRPRSSQRGPVKVGHVEAEQQLLALYFTSREDYDRTAAALENEYFLTPVNQFIKECIEGVGTDFNTVEDLQFKLMDRLAPEIEASAAFVEVIERVDEIRKMKMPIDVLLFQCKKRLLSEKVNRILANLKALLNAADNDTDLLALQSRISKLNMLNRTTTTLETLEELDEFKRNIEAAMAA